MFKWLKNNEHGSVMVIVALSLVVLMGFSGLAIDYSVLAVTKSDLQNAADAAALAAAQDLMDGLGQTVATSTAREYVAANGIALDDGITTVTVTFPTNKTVSVAITTKKQMAFTQLVTGRKTSDVNVLAVAEAAKILGGFPYALFAADKIDDPIFINGNNIAIVGNVHSNGSINMPAASVNGNVTCNGDADIGSVTNGSIDNNSPYMEMPNGDDLIALGKSGTWIYGDVTIKGKKTDVENNLFESFDALVQYAAKENPPGPNGLNIYITGSLNENGSKSSFYNGTDYNFPINLIVAGSITFRGCELNSTENCPIMLVSETGNLTVNGGGTGFYGVVFAPKGDATLNGGGQGNNPCYFYGSIIAKNITKSGGKIHVTYNQFVDDGLNDERVRLIK